MSEIESVAPELREHDEEDYDNSDVPNEEENIESKDDTEKLIDEEVYKIKAHRKAARSEDNSPKPVEKQATKKKPISSSQGNGKTLEDGTIVSDEEVLDEDEDLDPETRRRRELERKFDEALAKPQKRKKMDGDDIEQMQDERISELREKMRQAAIADAECIRNGEPALNKLNMLPEVRGVLDQKSLADSILDNNLLEAMRMWLEPLPDASLPAFEIQRALFNVIDQLPIKTIHLRESGLGKVVLFYQKSTRPQVGIKRIADRLIGTWTRPIMGRSDNYRDKQVAVKEYNRDAVLRSAAMSEEPAENESLADAAAIRRNRARIPVAKPVHYNVAPVNRIAEAQASRRRETQKEDQYKRIKQLMTSRGNKSSKKGGVSIEGKELRT